RRRQCRRSVVRLRRGGEFDRRRGAGAAGHQQRRRAREARGANRGDEGAGMSETRNVAPPPSAAQRESRAAEGGGATSDFLDRIARARPACLPVIMRGFVVESSQLVNGIAAGADAILLLASLLDGHRIREFISLLDAYNCDALVEVHDEGELDRAIEGGARII